MYIIKDSKRLFLLVLLSLMMIISACGNSEEVVEESEENGSEQVYKMKLGHANTEGDPNDVAANYFADLVNERAGGRVEIEVYPGGTLGDWRELIEGLHLDQNEIVIESVGTLNAYSDLANIDAVPYLYKDVDHFMNVWQSDVGKEILEQVGEDADLKLLAPQYRGARIVTSSKRFENLDELKGLNIRAPGIEMYIETWNQLGANPTPMALTEVYTGLQQGTVEAQENPVVNSYYFGFYDVNDYLIMTNHVYSATVFMFADDYFNGLPEDIREIIEEAALEAGEYRSNYVLDIEEEYVGKFEEQGVEVIYPDLEPFHAAFDGFVDEHFPYLVEYTDRILEID